MSSLLGRLLWGKEPSLDDLREALEDTKRRREEKRLGLEKLLVRRDHLLGGLKKARRAGDALKVDALWDELEEIRPDVALTRRELKVAGLEHQTLRRYVSGLEALDRRGDRAGVRRLLRRARTSRLPDLLSRAEIDEERYLAELDLLVSEEAEAEDESRLDDPRKEAFLRRLDAIADAESSGRHEEATQAEADLKQELEDGTV
jgi:hypothetical protein